MAQKFLDELPTVSLKDLPDGSRCMICLSDYGTTAKDDVAVEPVVRLPCGHDVGAVCIRKWLSPDEAARNSCPACRMTFFPALPRPYMEHGRYEDSDDDDDEDEDEDEESGDESENSEDDSEDYNMDRTVEDTRHRVPSNADRHSLRDILRVIAEDGQPRQEVPQIDREEQDAQDFLRSIWPRFLGATTEQYQESIRRARTFITESDRVADWQLWWPDPDPSDSWELIRLEDVEPQELENYVQQLATAYRTLPFREALTRSILRDLEASSRFIYPSRVDDLQPLNTEQEEALFQEMERRGAFRNYRHEYAGLANQHVGYTNRQRWDSHRLNGEAWNPDTRVWSPDWGYGEQMPLLDTMTE